MQASELKALLFLLDDEDETVKQEVWGRLKELGADIVPQLEEAWEASLDPEQQHYIAEAIHAVQLHELETAIASWGQEPEPDLVQGLWLVARYQYPDLDLGELRRNLEQLYFEAWPHFQGGLHPYEQIKRLNGIFYNQLKFKPNTRSFHSPANSMINMVLQSRRGNPISLCLVYMLIANRLNIPLFGVNTPNIFVLTYKKEERQFYINVYNKGTILSPEDISSYLKELKLPERDTFTQPSSVVDIVKRMLRNLARAFKELSELEKEEEVQRLIAALD